MSNQPPEIESPPWSIHAAQLRKHDGILSVFFVILILVLLNGCAMMSSGGSSRRGGASLSDAANTAKANKESREKESSTDDDDAGSDSSWSNNRRAEAQQPRVRDDDDANERREVSQQPRVRDDDTDRRGDSHQPRVRDDDDAAVTNDEPLILGETVYDDDYGDTYVDVYIDTGDELPEYDPLEAPAAKVSGMKHLSPAFLFSSGGTYFSEWRGMAIEAGNYATPNLRWDIGLQYWSGTFNYERDNLEGLTDPYEVALDLRFRYYAAGPHTFMGIYTTFGLRVGYFGWSFVAPVSALDLDTGIIDDVVDDGLAVFTPYVGLGFSPIQTEHFHLGASVVRSIRAFGEETEEGFANDLFSVDGFWEMRVQFSLFF